MTISFFTFFDQMISNPVLAITVLLTLAVILVNGWTDAPNAIATCVSTRAIGVDVYKRQGTERGKQLQGLYNDRCQWRIDLLGSGDHKQ